VPISAALRWTAGMHSHKRAWIFMVLDTSVWRPAKASSPANGLPGAGARFAAAVIADGAPSR